MAYYSGHGPRHVVKPKPTLEDFKRAALGLYVLLVVVGRRIEPLIHNLDHVGARLERASALQRLSS